MIITIIIITITVIGQARVDERSTQAIELYVPNTPGNLASALCAFDTYVS